jgi:hypothetical protein
MSDLMRWFGGQPVKHNEMRAFALLMDAAVSDSSLLEWIGDFPVSGLDVTIQSALTLAVAAGYGVATYTDTGGDADPDAVITPATPLQLYGDLKRFVRFAGGTIAISPSARPAGGQERWALVGLHFKRINSTSRTDDEEVTAPFYGKASSELVVTLGTAAGIGAATKPTTPTDTVPLVHVYLVNGLVTLTEAYLDRSAARPAFGLQGTKGGVPAQIADLAATQLDNCRGFVVEPQITNAMVVGVRAGRINFSDESVTVAGGQTVTLVAPGGGLHRIALVWIDTSGVVQLTYGTSVALAGAAAAPSFEGRFPVAIYDVADTTASLLPASLVDVRPFQRVARDVPNRYRYAAINGDTAVTIVGWTFIVGAHALMVYKNGLLLSETDYTENAAGDGITGLDALVGGHSGLAASITSAGDLATITGLAGITTASVGRRIVLSTAATSGHNGTFTVEEYVSGTSVKVANAAAAGADANNGTITWAIPGDVVELVAPRVAGANPAIAHAAAHAADGSDPIDYSTIGGLVLPGFEMFATGDNAITVRPFAAVVGGSLRASNSDINLAAQLVSGAACDGGTIDPGSWRYLYSYWSGAMAIEVSVTAPDVFRRMKLGDASRTYLGALSLTTTAAKVRRFRKTNRHVVYRPDDVAGVTATRDNPYDMLIAIISGGTATAPVSGAVFFPPHVKSGELRVVAYGSSAAGFGSVAGRLNGDSGSSDEAYSFAPQALTSRHGPSSLIFSVGLDVNRAFDAGTQANVSLDLYAVGYEE